MNPTARLAAVIAGAAECARFRYFAAFGLVVVVLWGAIAYALNSQQREGIDRATVAGLNLARSLAKHEEASIRAIDGALQNLRGEWVRNSATFAREANLQRAMLADEQTIQISVADASGRLTYSRIPAYLGIDHSERLYFKVLKERNSDELYISKPVLGRISGQWTILFARRILDDRNRFAGAILISIPSPQLQHVYNDIELGAGGSVTLVRSDGQILAHSYDLPRMINLSLADSPALRPGNSDSGNYARPAKYSRGDRIYAFHKVKHYPLTVIVGQYANTVLAPYFVQRRIYTVFGAAATAVLLALTLLLISRSSERKGVDRSRAQLAAIVQGSSDAIMSVSLDGEIETWNGGCERLYGYRAAEVVGRQAHEILKIPQDQMAELREARKRIARGESVPPIDRVRVVKGGRRIEVSIGRFPIKDKNGKVRGNSAIVRDITERKRMEQALQTNERRLRALLDSLPIGVVRIDKSEHVIFANRTSQEIYGDPSGPVPPTLLQFLGEEIYAIANPHFKRALAGEEVRYERTFCDKDGLTRTRSVRYAPDRDAGGEIVGAFAMREDITDRKRAEEEIRRINQDLERRVHERTIELRGTIDALRTEVERRARAEVSALTLAQRVKAMARRLGEAQETERRRMAAEVHDGVCSNLAAIGLNLALLERQLANADAAGMKVRLTDLIAQVDYAQATAKNIAVDLRPLLENGRDLYSALADYGQKFQRSTGIAVEIKGSGAERQLGATQNIALFRIAQEALTNCAKHAQAQAVVVELGIGATHTQLSISDNGVGFDPGGINQMSRGLGLLSMQERSDAIGGTWHVESAPGIGTRISVRVESGRSA